MKILITGGTGFVGAALTAKLLELGHEVTAIGSRPTCQLTDHERFTYISADTTRPGDWQEAVERQDGLINLAGRSVFNLWTTAYKAKIRDSRILTTSNLVAALPEKTQTILISASAAGYYGNGGEHEKIESDAVGSDFLAQVCNDWEAGAMKASLKGARVAITRFGVILGKGGGAITTMKTPFQLAMGGPIGSGKQWFPWIHLDDVLGAIIYILQSETLSGVFNFTAPEQTRQKDFARSLGKVLHRPALVPAPAFVMKMVLGEFGSSLLQGQKVIPKALQESGYVFFHPVLDTALEEILGG